jgi:hypothetical protein
MLSCHTAWGYSEPSGYDRLHIRTTWVTTKITRVCGRDSGQCLAIYN